MGDTLRVEVSAGGARPLRYQWYRNDQTLDSATNDVYQRLNAQVADSGSYAVEIANAFGTNRTPSVAVRVAEPGPARTFSYAGAPVAIPDDSPAGATASIVVSEALEVLQLRISLQVTHTYRGDLRVVLRSPGGLQVIVQEQNIGDSQANLVITGRSLAGFDGASAQGTWRLQVIDVFADDTGRLESWSIEITPPAPSLAVAFSTWMQSFTSLADPQRAAGGDPDGDGVPNLLEYLLEGESPEVANGGPHLTVPAAAPEYYEYAVAWRSGVDASCCKLWMCEGLGETPWQEVTDRGTDIVVDRSDPGRLVVRCRRTLPRMFLQLRAEAARL